MAEHPQLLQNLHPTIAPPPVSAFSNGDLGAKLITIVDLHNEVTELATNVVNGGSYAASRDPRPS